MSSVRRHSSASMNAIVTTTDTTLENTVPSVLVTACCAPITSLFIRDISDAGLRAGEERQRLVLHVVEQRGAHVEDEALADPGRVVALHEREAGVEQGEEHRAEGEQRRRAAVLLGDRGVDQRPQDERRHRADDRGEHHGDDEADRAARGTGAARRRTRRSRSRSTFLPLTALASRPNPWTAGCIIVGVLSVANYRSAPGPSAGMARR